MTEAKQAYLFSLQSLQPQHLRAGGKKKKLSVQNLRKQNMGIESNDNKNTRYNVHLEEEYAQKVSWVCICKKYSCNLIGSNKKLAMIQQ